MSKEIPQAVIEEAQGLIDRYGRCMDYLGKYKDADYYVFHFPDETITGFPFVYVYYRQKEEVIEITGFDALDIIGKFGNELN